MTSKGTAEKSPKPSAADTPGMQVGNTWFVTLGGHEKGPFSPQQLRDLVTWRQIGDGTPVRRGDLTSAVPAGQIRGLLPASPSSGVLQAPTRRVRANSSSIEPAPSEAEIPTAKTVPTGRATAGQRLQSMAIDLVVIGGLAVGMLVYAWVLPQRSMAALSADIDAARATTSAQQVANRGEPRPRLADWPTVAIEVQKRIVAKQALIEVEKSNLTKPAPSMTPSRDQLLQETLVKNLENELVFLNKYHEFETNRAVQDQAAIAAAPISARPLQGILIGLALAFVCFAAPICVHVSGGTPGHWLMGLRVVGPTRRPIGFRTSLWRHAGSLAPWAQFALLNDPTASARHDHWSRTEVVSRRAVVHGRASTVKGESSKGQTRSTKRVSRRVSA